MSCAFVAAVLALPACRRSSDNGQALVINEVMPGGDGRPLAGPEGLPIVDAEGQAADWVEVFNPLAVPVNLTGYSLSDDPAEPGKFRFPGIVLGPAGSGTAYVVVVLDNNPLAGPLHASFGLRGEGETVYLFGPAGRGLDRRGFGQLEAGSSQGRFPDGNGQYGEMFHPTPGAPNKPIGARAPRFQGPARLAGGGPGAFTVELRVLEDKEFEITSQVVEAGPMGPAEPCVPLPVGAVFAVSVEAVVVTRGPVDAEGRSEAILHATLAVQDLSALRLRSTVENEVGRAVQIDCCVGCERPTVVINEFQPRNVNTILFDEYEVQNPDAPPNQRRAIDWLELFNYGTQPVSLANFFLLGNQDYLDFKSAQRPPGAIFWQFHMVGIDLIQPGEHLLVLADGDFPYLRENGQLVLDDEGNKIPNVNAYARTGQTDLKDRKYRSADLQIADGNPNNPPEGEDRIALLDGKGVEVDVAHFNFSDLGELGPDLSFGRVPDAGQREDPLTHFNGVDTGGEILQCATPEAPNVRLCGDIQPIFERAVTVGRPGEPRCPGAGSPAEVTSFVAIDQDTAALDKPAEQDLQFEVELHFRVNGDPQPPLTRQDGRLELCTAEQCPGDFSRFNPIPVPGATVYRIRGAIPGQPAGALVEFALRARDLRLDGPWVEHGEASAPEVTFRFEPGFQRPPVIINEVLPNSDPLGAVLLFGPERIEVPPMDFVELFNDSAGPVDLSGMWLDDERFPAVLGPQGQVRKFQFPPGARIEPLDFLCLFFPRSPAEAQGVPPGALAVTELGLDDCLEALFLLAPDGDGNCVVADARWDVRNETGQGLTCPDEPAPVGRIPDGEKDDPILDRMETLGLPSSPGRSNCGGQDPVLVSGPIHSSIQGRDPMRCVTAGQIVRIQATALIDAFADIGHPGSVQPGIAEARLLIKKGDVEEDQPLSVVVSRHDAPHKCLVRMDLDGFILPPHAPVTTYRLRVVDLNGNSLPETEFSYGLAGTKPALFLNEVMARSDDGGPWIEVWNGSAAEISLGGMSLTDDLTAEADDPPEPRKWIFPESTTVPPGGFLVVFADGDTSNPDDLHASFTLNATGGGDVFLLDRTENGTCVIDSFHYDYSVVPAGGSQGLLPDGAGDPVVLPAPTRGRSNGGRTFIRGDVDSNGKVGVTDLGLLSRMVQGTAPRPSCQDSADVNDDGAIDQLDVTRLGNYLFEGGEAIPPPHPSPGADPTPDALECL